MSSASAVDSPIERLALIGVGLIGGSLARALKSAGVCSHVVGYARDPAALERAKELGVIDEYRADPETAVQGADMVVLAIPVGVIKPIMGRIAAHLSPQAVITDVGSTKGSVVADARATLDGHLRKFVPGHPIAGNEKRGVDASFAELFEAHRVILTPLPETSPQAFERVKWMWERTGAMVEVMDVEEHDQVLAATSHLPHALAFTLVHSLATMDDSERLFRFAAGGFADFTRIASSSPEMWRDIVVNNPRHLIAMIERFKRDLDQLADAIGNNDGETIRRVFDTAKCARDRFTERRLGRGDQANP